MASLADNLFYGSKDKHFYKKSNPSSLINFNYGLL